MPARYRLLATPLVAPLLAAATAVLPAAPARAAVSWHTVSLSSGFAPADVTILQGDTLVLTNADATDRHDVTALDWQGGAPLFASSTITFGQSATVLGTASLPPSVYPFYCSVHEYMTGTLTVLSAAGR
jgi:plastocyanin